MNEIIRKKSFCWTQPLKTGAIELHTHQTIDFFEVWGGDKVKLVPYLIEFILCSKFRLHA